MLLFGHAGITTGVIKVYEKIVLKKKNIDINFIDYRVVLVGSLLPDIIDKPLVQLIYGLQDHSGHFFAHSFIFSSLLILIGIIILKLYRNNNILLLGVCSLLHQLMDILILYPKIFIYPLFSRVLFIVPKNLGLLDKVMSPIYKAVPYFKDVELYLLEPYIYIFEVIGFLIIVYFICKLIRNKNMVKFFKSGLL